MVQCIPKDSYFDHDGGKSLQTKAQEAIAQMEREQNGGAAGTRKSVGGGSSMFPRAFWKNSQDLNQEKVRSCRGWRMNVLTPCCGIRLDLWSFRAPPIYFFLVWCR